MKSTAERKGMKTFLQANHVATNCERVLQLLQKTNESLVQLNGFITGIETNILVTGALSEKMESLFVSLEKHLNHRMTHTNASPLNVVFKPQFQCQHYTHAAKPNFQIDNRATSITIEAKIKQRLLKPNEPRHAILAIQGEAGVGKTTTLNMLSY